MADVEKLYADWIQTLSPQDRAVAMAAGLDQPPSDDHSKHARGGSELRDYDGLPLFLKNGSVHPLQHEATRDFSINDDSDEGEGESVAIVSDLAAAMRRVMEFIVRGMGPEQIFERPVTISQRVFAVCRAIQIGGCEQPTLAAVATVAGVTRSSLSKCCVELRDAVGNEHVHFAGREAARATMRQVTSDAWKRRRGE